MTVHIHLKRKICKKEWVWGEKVKKRKTNIIDSELEIVKKTKKPKKKQRRNLNRCN